MEESSFYRSIVAEGAAKEKREITLNLLRDGLSIKVIARETKLSIEEVQLLQQDLNIASAPESRSYGFALDLVTLGQHLA